MAMRTPTLSAGSGEQRGARDGLPLAPLENPPKFAPKTPAGLDFSVSLGVDSCAVLPPFYPHTTNPTPQEESL